jgi:hypothetical protein
MTNPGTCSNNSKTGRDARPRGSDFLTFHGPPVERDALAPPSGGQIGRAGRSSLPNEPVGTRGLAGPTFSHSKARP